MAGKTFTIEEAEAVKQTPDALLIHSDNLPEDLWFPRSQIDDDSEVYELGHKGDLVVSEWIAIQKGLV